MLVFFLKLPDGGMTRYELRLLFSEISNWKNNICKIKRKTLASDFANDILHVGSPRIIQTTENIQLNCLWDLSADVYIFHFEKKNTDVEIVTFEIINGAVIIKNVWFAKKSL